MGIPEIIGRLLGLVSKLFLYFAGRQSGVNRERMKDAENKLATIERAMQIRDRLRTDPDYRQRVRQSFLYGRSTGKTDADP